MSTIADCIDVGLNAGEITADRAQAAKDEFNRLVARYESNLDMTRHQAEASAAADLKEATRKSARARFHAIINQLEAFRLLKHQIETAPDPGLALKALLEDSPSAGFQGANVRYLQEALNQETAANLRQMLEVHHQSLIGGTTNKAGFDNMIDEMHGDATGDAAARDLATIVMKEQDRLRRMANARGMDIGELAHYGVAHSHDPAAVARAGFDVWAARIEKLGAWDRIIDKSTGRPFATEKGIVPPRAVTEDFLRSMYRNITTGGWADRTAGAIAGGKALYNRRADHREFHFATGQGWRDYNREFGASDPFTALLHGLHGLNRDIALMKVLGPNPSAGLEFAIQTATIKAAKSGNKALQDAVKKNGDIARGMLHGLDGSQNVIGDQAAAAMMRGTRQFLGSAYLGSAVLSAPTDLVTVSVGAHIMGLKPANVLSQAVKLAASPEERATAATAGFIFDTLTDAGGGAARFMGQMIGTGISQRLSNITMRASGLSFWTDMLRTAVKMEFGAELARNAHLPFDQINDGIRTIFERRGISARDWDRLRDPAALFRDPRTGATMITPHSWRAMQRSTSADQADDLALKLSMSVQEKLAILIPTSNLEVTTRVLAGTSAGTIGGEVLRGGMMFRGYTASLMVGQYRQFAALKGGWETKVGLAALTFTGLLLMGALSIQLKELAKGNDPRPMDRGVFWKAALFQGGGLGIFGDFFASEESRTGQGLAGTLMGPQASLAGDLIGLFAHTSGSFGRDLSTLVRKDFPVLSTLWYVRAAYNRVVADTLQSFLDPHAQTQWDQQVSRMQKDYGNRPFIARGAAGARLPNLSNAFGGSQ